MKADAKGVQMKTTKQAAGEQADAILAFDGDEPDEVSRALRAALDRGEITPEEYRATVIHRAQQEDDAASGEA